METNMDIDIAVDLRTAANANKHYLLQESSCLHIRAALDQEEKHEYYEIEFSLQFKLGKS